MDKENLETPRRNISVTMEQKRLIVEFIKKNSMLASGKFSTDFTQKDGQLLWQKLTSILNSCPGATKDWKSWRKTWQDIRSRTKIKQSKLRTHRAATGGGAPEIDTITPYETEVLEIIKTVSVEGHTNIKESNVEFSFDTPEIFESDKDIVGSDGLPSETFDKNPLDKIENISSISSSGTQGEINNKRKFEFKTKNLPSVNTKSKAPRKKLLHASQASESYRTSLEQKNKIKKDYYEKKIEILERMTIAKEKSAVAKEKLADNIKNLAEILQEFL